VLLEAYPLRIECKAITPIILPPFKGSAIRGALFSALRRDFCIDASTRECEDARVREACPVCLLLATVNEDGARGREVARPLTVEPPLDSRKQRYEPGETFSFGLTLFGQANDLLPYVVLGLLSMGQLGLGNRARAPGQFSVERVWSYSPLSGEKSALYVAGTPLVQARGVSVRHEDVLVACREAGEAGTVSLDLLTPTRLVLGGKLLKDVTFESLLRRVLRRLNDLCLSACGEPLGIDHVSFLEAARAVEKVADTTRWLDVPSFSSRQGRYTPIGGLIGSLTFTGELAAFLPWLLWGAITHIGKDATKGGGWYRLRWQS